MSRRRSPQNKLCRNSKLSEREFLAVVWSWLAGYTAEETSTRLREKNGFEIDERSVRTYFNRAGAYLYEYMRDIEMQTLVGDLDALRAAFSDAEYEELAARVFELSYDALVTNIGRQNFLILKELRSPSLIDAMYALNELTAKRKKAISKKKKEAVAWACFHDRIRAPLLAQGLSSEKILENTYIVFYQMLLAKPL